MNTKIVYQYRDAGNNKVVGEFVLVGKMTGENKEKVCNVLAAFPENGFIPEKVGLPSLIDQFVFGSGFDPEMDHDWHEWIEAVETSEPASADMSVGKFMKLWDEIAQSGWDALDRHGKFGVDKRGQ